MVQTVTPLPPPLATPESAIPKCAKEDLDGLLGEVTALAAQLRQIAGELQTPGGLPVGGKMVLEVLARYGAKTVPQVARIRATSRQNIQVLVNKLEKDGHVSLVQNPAHKRSPFVELTESGKAALGQMLQTEESARQSLFLQLSKSDVLSSAELLNRIRKLLDGAGKMATPQPSAEVPVRDKRSGPISNDTIREQKVGNSKSESYDRSKTQEGFVYNDLPVSLL